MKNNLTTTWLPRGKVLSQMHEMREEMLIFFNLEEKTKFCELLADEIWSAKLCYMEDMFEHLNKVNASMQGRNKNMLTSDKIEALVEKNSLWNERVSEDKIDMFQKTAEAKYTDIVSLIKQHLESLETIFQIYLLKVMTG